MWILGRWFSDEDDGGPRPTAKRYGYEIVDSYPHDTSAYTQGLIYHQGFLYESTGHYEGQSSVREVALKTGKVLRKHTLGDDYFAEGLTLWEDRLIQLTWRENTIFIYDPESFNDVRKVEDAYSGEGWGLTHDGTHLIISDGTTKLRFLDPTTFEEARTVKVRDEKGLVHNINELEYIDGEVFANIYGREEIFRIDPKTGHVVGKINLSGLLTNLERSRLNEDDVLNGIAYDSEGKRLFVTGKNWPRLFEIRVTEG